MDLRAGFSDSNEISNNSSTSIVAAATANAETGLSHPLDILTHPEVAALQLLSNNLESVFDSPESFYSDAKLVLANGREVSVHRCLLSSRSSFFKSVFESAKENGGGGGEGESGDVKIDVKELANDFDVGFDSLVAVLAYVYCGRVRPHPKGVCECVDEVCSHAACRPVVDFMVEVLYLAFTFQIPELVALYQRYLLDLVDKVARDDVLVILSVADKCVQACKRLMDWCIETIVKSDVDIVTIEKTLSDYLVKQIIDSRIQLGLDTPESSNFPDKHVKRIFRALDSDDVELVNMLLKEGNTNLDDAHALHYAVAYCDAKITTELLDLALADVNARNSRGYTVLHVAAMRKEPKLIVSLLTKGARPSDLTLDGRKALQLAKRLTKAVDYNNSTEEGRLSPKDRLCIEILEQAERREPLVGEASLSLAMAGDDLRLRLLYLENRVALARLLFPMEAQVAMDIAQVNGTTELPLARLEPESLVKTKRTSMDLNAAPFKIQEEHLNRLKALSRTVELGKYFFPRCSEVLNGIMDAEDLSQLACIEKDTPEERLLKKRRYVELQEVLSKAFDKDKEELDKSVISSSSSSTSKSIGMVKPNRKTIHKTR